MVIAYVWLLQSVVRTAGLSMNYQFTKNVKLFTILIICRMEYSVEKLYYLYENVVSTMCPFM